MHRVVVLIFGGISLKRSASRSVSRRVILLKRLHVVCRKTKCTPSLRYSTTLSLDFFSKGKGLWGRKAKQHQKREDWHFSIRQLSNPVFWFCFLTMGSLFLLTSTHFFLCCAASHDKLPQPAVFLCGRARCLTALSWESGPALLTSTPLAPFGSCKASISQGYHSIWEKLHLQGCHLTNQLF